MTTSTLSKPLIGSSAGARNARGQSNRAGTRVGGRRWRCCARWNVGLPNISGRQGPDRARGQTNRRGAGMKEITASLLINATGAITATAKGL
jgi:hypothetical protein